MKRIHLLLLFATVIVLLIAVLPVSANCAPAKTFTMYNTIETPGAYYYILWGDTSVTSDDIDARFWETGNRSGANEGTYDDSEWLIDSLYYPGTDLWYLNGNLGAAGVSGCPNTSLTVVGTNSKTGTFFSAVIEETPPRSQTYDYSRLLTDFPTVAMPPPRIISSTRTGTDVNISVQIDDASAGVFGGAGAEISDVVIYQAVSPTSTDIASGWVEIGRIGGPAGTTSVLVDCSDPNVQASIGAGLAISNVDPINVGPDQSLVECDAHLADPGRGRSIDRPDKPGRGTPPKRR